MSIKVGTGKFSPEIENEIIAKGYHIYNYALAVEDYPNSFINENTPKEIEIGKRYTLRLFVKIEKGLMKTIDSGLIDIKIIRKDKDSFLAEILTLLPVGFPLRKGQRIDVKKEEILYEQVSQILN